MVAYNHALRASGAKLVEAGYMGYPGKGATYAWQVEAAISERTVALAFQLVDAPNTLGLDEVIRIAHARGLPVIVDAAAALPPADNLRRFIAAGADLVTFSGGKAIGGPQASGILCGRADLIRSVALQHQDMDVNADTWELREAGLPGIPHHGIGRSMKVGKEEILGLVAALRAYCQRDHLADQARWLAQLQHIERALCRVPGLITRLSVPDDTAPQLWIETGDRLRAAQVIRSLESGQPRVWVSQTGLEKGQLVINPLVLKPGEERIVADRLVEELRC
jgi:L-seryl-tRNA(Ser) seleniumtransferase